MKRWSRTIISQLLVLLVVVLMTLTPVPRIRSTHLVMALTALGLIFLRLAIANNHRELMRAVKENGIAFDRRQDKAVTELVHLAAAFREAAERGRKPDSAVLVGGVIGKDTAEGRRCDLDVTRSGT